MLKVAPIDTSGLQNVGAGAEKKAQSQATPIGRFAIVLIIFAIVTMLLPPKVRGWFVIIILLGAFSVNTGAIEDFTKWTLGR